MKIGFIGLGIMGKPMALNLIKAGHELVVYDVQRASLGEALAAGAVEGGSPADVAARCGVVITMLPNSPHVREAVLGKGGFVEGAKKGSLLIDMSSIAPLVSREVAEVLGSKGIDMLDAPVSGGEPKAIDGTLAIMVGGDKGIFERVKEVLLRMGSSAVYCGAIGSGNVTKLANQVIVGLNIAAMSEAFVLATKAGVDPALVFEAIKGGLAGSTVLNAKVPKVLKGDFAPGFRIELHIKDLQNALDTGHAIGAPLPFTSQVMEIMQALKVEGKQGQDHCGLIQHFERMAGVAVRS